MNKELNYLDRNEFNFTPSDEVVNAIKNFDIRKLDSTPVSTMRVRKVYSPNFLPNTMVSTKSRLSLVMVPRTF